MGVAADWRAAARAYREALQALAEVQGRRSDPTLVDAIVRDLHRYAERQVSPSDRRAFIRACGLTEVPAERVASPTEPLKPQEPR